MERPPSHPGVRARCPAARRLPGALAAVAALGLGFSAHAAERMVNPRQAQARPSLPPEQPFKSPLWKRHVEIGGEAALVMRLSSHDLDGQPSDIRYAPAIGYGFHARMELYRYLHFTAWFLSARHDVRLVPASFGVAGDFTAPPLSIPPAETMVFGARLAPTLPLSSRGRAWVTLGAGWGRMHMPRALVDGHPEQPFVHARSSTFVEVPLGMGASFEIIPRWLAIEIQTTGAFVMGQSGEALEPAQAIDALGRRRSIRALPSLDASFVQTLGLSILL
jgi:hypothetical protein